MDVLKITPQEARRTAVAAQRLSGPYPDDTKENLLNLMRQIRCLQLDPIRAVERTQYLVLWSRLGQYSRDYLHQLLYEDRHLFEYWAHAASIVLTEDFPIHERMMRRYGQGGSGWAKRLAKWVSENGEFKEYILNEIDRRGPLLTKDFDDQSKVPWASGGWSTGRSVAYMIDYLWTKGEIFVSKRDGLKRWWDLSHRVMPEWTPDGGWSAEQVTREATQKSLKALGIGRARDIGRHFIERRYHNLNQILAELQAEEIILPVEIEAWPDQWFIHRDNLPLVNAIQQGEWHPRTTLLSPFDNLIRDRDRTELMWNFYYRIEIYVPKAKREYGYYVLPILHGEELIGRVSPRMDRKKKVLDVEAVYAEDNAPVNKETGTAVRRAIENLAQFLGAKTITYGTVPKGWQTVLK